MKFRNKTKLWATALGSAAAVTVMWLPQAKGELVYENEQQQVTQAASSNQPTKVVERVTVSNAASTEDAANMSKRELMRRERMRAELQNEDVLQERLEELRLRDERKRTEQVLGISSNGSLVETTKIQQTQAAPLKEEVIIAPVTERPATAQTHQIVAQAAPVATVVAETRATEKEDEASSIVFQPRLGMPGMNNSGYDIRPYFTGGLGMGFGASDNVVVELGYAYSEFGINVAGSNPIVNYLNSGNLLGYGGIYPGNGTGFSNQFSFETQVMKQHLFDAGLKIYLIGKDSKVRPFIGAGLAYSRGSINYNQRILNNLNQVQGFGGLLANSGMAGLSQPYEIASFLGFVQAGFDFKVSKTIQVGLLGKYYNVFTARENSLLNNMAFYGPGSMGAFASPYILAANGLDKQAVGGTLANSGFYQILGTVTFSF